MDELDWLAVHGVGVEFAHDFGDWTAFDRRTGVVFATGCGSQGEAIERSSDWVRTLRGAASGTQPPPESN